MSLEDVQEGIGAVQAGDLRAADRLLRGALNRGDLPNEARAVALMWLAETSNSTRFKIECHELAVEVDPHSAAARQRLRKLRGGTLPLPDQPRPAQPPTLPNQNRMGGGGAPLSSDAVPRMWEFGVRGGPNGIGTGFLIVRDGLVATTRFTVGSNSSVTLIDRNGGERQGQVVRSYPAHDLAFVRSSVQVPYLRDMTPAAVRAGTPLTADDYTARTEVSTCRSPYRKSQNWFLTDFDDGLMDSFTGAPLINDRNDLVGMLTRNANRDTGTLYGLHILFIRRKVEEFYIEVQDAPDHTYCGTCGCRSLIDLDNDPYCRICGTVSPAANQHRRPSQFPPYPR